MCGLACGWVLVGMGMGGCGRGWVWVLGGIWITEAEWVCGCVWAWVCGGMGVCGGEKEQCLSHTDEYSGSYDCPLHQDNRKVW